MNVFRKEYALYKGDEILSVGTIKEISEQLNVKIKTLRGYGNKGYIDQLEKKDKHNARILVVLE